ncbi:MAG TPA: NupC/NupG family nucleoside CNT transporter [Pirellulales bacterium]|nr:NupC/NupG family nucleoside CNT transporter [Pirellulales bacterium]
MERLISFCGLFVMIGLAWLMSADRWKVRPRVIVGTLLLQLTFGMLTLWTVPGEQFFHVIGDAFTALLGFVDSGTTFVFGINAKPDEANMPNRLALVRSFAFGVLPTIIFFSALMSILYHLGIMQWVVKVVAIVMQKTLRTSGAESLSAASNIFVGQTEAPLIIRPFVNDMTNSELMAVMIGGFATVAGGVMAAYVSFGVSAEHLVRASVIAAPGALMMAKILQPEVGVPKTLGRVEMSAETGAANVIEAAAIGASDGVKLAINVAAMLIAFLALIAMFDAMLGWVGTQVGYVGESTWTLRAALGYAFRPFAWLIGVPWVDSYKVGQLLGTRMAANEFLAYVDLSAMKTNQEISERAQVLATYALCGFANFSSIGIQIGGIGAIAPSRQGDLARLGLRAMFGGTLACFCSACIAGILI